MCKPHRCPHVAYTGSVCLYCAGGPDSDFEYSTQSYTGYEPTRFPFDSLIILQHASHSVSIRPVHPNQDACGAASSFRPQVSEFWNSKNSVDKVEFVVMGGTFLSLEQSYQDEFIMKLHDALSGHHSHSVEEAVK